MKTSPVNPRIPKKPFKIAVVQVNAGNNVGANLKRLEKLIARITDCDLISLPEVFCVRGNDLDYRANAQTLKSDVVQWLKHVACARGAWVLGGSIIEKDRGNFFNTCFLFDRCGRISAKYRKIHLFEANLDNGQTVRESDIYSAGLRPVVVNIEGWVCGLSICYDLRFPELYRHYSSRQAHLFFVPANFTRKTGKDHWETLLRARAIENQVFVVAPDQCGRNPETGIASYGNSMIVGPWGEVITRAGGREYVLTATLNPEDLRRTRSRIPALSHRRI